MASEAVGRGVFDAACPKQVSESCGAIGGRERETPMHGLEPMDPAASDVVGADTIALSFRKA